MSLPDKNSYDALGGELVDYSPPEDPNTDLAAQFSNEARADTAAMTRMIGRAYVAFTYNGSSCTVTDHDAVWGNDVSVKPTVVHNNVGDYTVTWPTTVTDARGITHNVNLRQGSGNCEQEELYVSVRRASANSMRVFVSSATAPGVTDPISTRAVVVVVW